MDESKVAIFLVSSVYKFVYNKKRNCKIGTLFPTLSEEKKRQKALLDRIK